MQRALIKLLALVISLCLLTTIFSCTKTVYVTPVPTTTTTPTPTPTPIPLPIAPISLGAEALTYNTVNLWWTDICDNEEGFKIYRSGILVGTVGANVNTFQDHNLTYATNYSYSLSAYNKSGESPSTTTLSIKTPNPPIRIILDAVGVYDSGDSSLRGTEGEQYLFFVVSDGKNSD